MNTPHLYITYFKDSEAYNLGPYYTASFNGYLQHSDSVYYVVQKPNLEFVLLTVPASHYLKAVLTPEGRDV